MVFLPECPALCGIILLILQDKQRCTCATAHLKYSLEVREHLRPNRRQIYIRWHTTNAYESLNDQICSTHSVAYTTKNAQQSYDNEPNPTQFAFVVSDPNAVDGRKQVRQHVCQ
jgi:hypothetical protein